MEIGDTIDTETETAPTQRKRPGRGAQSDGGGAIESAEQKTRRRRNGSRAIARRSNNGGSDGDGTASIDELQTLLDGLRDLRDGEFGVRMPKSSDPLMAEIADAFNGIAERNERLSSEVVRVATTIGREGQMNERASIGRATGGWATMTSSLNSLITDLASPTTEVARVLTAVAEGDLSQKMVLEIDGKTVQGEFLRIGTTVNKMVDQLSAFASEVTRVAKEVGTEGKLGGQATRARCCRNVEGSHRQREHSGREPHEPGAKHRRRDDGRRKGRSVAGRSRSKRAAKHSSSRTRSTRWWISSAHLLPK